MSDKVHAFKRLVAERFPDSKLAPVPTDDIANLRSEYRTIPSHLIDLLQTVGCGSIGPGRYMIHFPSDCSEFYDDETAAGLGKILIVGDDYSGNCDGYDLDNDWAFGTIGALGEFDSLGDEFPTIVDWLLNVFSDDS